MDSTEHGNGKDTIVDELMAKLKAYDWGGDRGALAGIDEAVAAARNDKDKLAVIESALLDVVQSDATLPAKEYACRKLALIGTSRCVPVLAGMLLNAELSDRALLALEAIPDASVDDALRTALPSAEGTLRVGIVNTLGERRDADAVPALSEIKNSPDPVLE